MKSEIVTMLRNLQEHTLDPRFEQFGNFILAAKGHKTLFWGNFLDVSAVFHVVTDDPKLIEAVTNVIRANQQTPEYLTAKADRLADRQRLRDRQHRNGYIESDNGPYAAY